MTIKDLLGILGTYQRIEIMGDYCNSTPHFAGLVRDFMGSDEYEFLCKREVDGIFSEGEDRSNYISIYYNDSEFEGKTNES